ncbi:hypothetical protein D9M70_643810 [compost metagenome]
MPRMCLNAASRCAPRISPWLATKLAASSRASRTILSSLNELLTPVVASEVAAVTLTVMSVVTTKLVANALLAHDSNAATPNRRKRLMLSTPGRRKWRG